MTMIISFDGNQRAVARETYSLVASCPEESGRPRDRSTRCGQTLAEPELIVPGHPPRQVLMRRYFDKLLQQEMLLRIVVEDTPSERVVVTLYKAAQLDKNLKGGAA